MLFLYVAVFVGLLANLFVSLSNLYAAISNNYILILPLLKNIALKKTLITSTF